MFDWRNPTDPIFTADPKYFYFFVQKKFKNPVEQIFSFSIALWCLHRVEKPPNPKNVLQKKWRCAFVPFVFVCVWYILCSGMWNIDLKKKKIRPTYPIFFSMLRQSNNFFLGLSNQQFYDLTDNECILTTMFHHKIQTLTISNLLMIMRKIEMSLQMSNNSITLCTCLENLPLIIAVEFGHIFTSFLAQTNMHPDNKSPLA